MSQPGVGRRKWLRQRPIFSRRAALQLLEQKIVLTIIIAMPARRKEPRSPTTGDVKTFTPFDTRQKTNNRPRTCKLNKNPHNNFDSMLSSHANYFSKGTPRKSSMSDFLQPFFLASIVEHSSLVEGLLWFLSCHSTLVKEETKPIKYFMLHLLLVRFWKLLRWSPKRNIWSAQGIDCHSQSPKRSQPRTSSRAASRRADDEESRPSRMHHLSFCLTITQTRKWLIIFLSILVIFRLYNSLLQFCVPGLLIQFASDSTLSQQQQLYLNLFHPWGSCARQGLMKKVEKQEILQ